MRVALDEATSFAEAATPAEGPGSLLVQVITPGWGSSGYYSKDVLEAAGRDKVWPAGTHMYVDHPSESEAYERPERTVKDLAAVTTADATWDESLGALVAPVRVFSHWRAPLAEMADVIGVSIRGSAEATMGEAEGRQGRVFTRLTEGASIDFVTKAGRGGKVLQVIESARVSGRAIARGVAEATANDRREQLSALVKDAHGSENVWPWVRDFDDTTVWFEIDSSDSVGTYQQAYATTDDVASALTGDRVEVRASTTYVPVGATAESSITVRATLQAGEYVIPKALAETLAAGGIIPALTDVPSRPAGQSTHQESQEDTMPQIEEARLRQLETDAGRATVAESERDTAIRERDEARQQLAESRRVANAATAERVVREAFDAAQVTAPKTVARLALAATLTESGDVDVAALKAAAEESAAELAEASGAGRVRGLGGTHAPTASDEDGDLSEADLDAQLARLSGRQIKEA
jgi:hypothetical protein